jgi:hypothetical protein
MGESDDSVLILIKILINYTLLWLLHPSARQITIPKINELIITSIRAGGYTPSYFIFCLIIARFFVIL